MKRSLYLDMKKRPSSNPAYLIGGLLSSEASEKPETSTCKHDNIEDIRRLQKIIDQLQMALRPKQVGNIVDMSKETPSKVVYSDLTFDESTLERINKNPGVLGLHFSSKMDVRNIKLTNETIRVYYLHGKTEYDFLPYFRFDKQSLVYYNGTEGSQSLMEKISKKVIACIWVWQGFFEVNSSMKEPVLRQEMEELKMNIAKLTAEVRINNQETIINISKIREEMMEELKKTNDRTGKMYTSIKAILDHYEQQITVIISQNTISK